MSRRLFVSILLVLLFVITPFAFADDLEIAGVKFPSEKTIEGKILKLNGVSVLKKFGFVQIYAVGLYLEEPTRDAEKVINSEQMKYVHTQYLTKKATGEKIRDGFVGLISHCNSPELVHDNKANIDRFASWLDADMGPGLSSETIYIPGHGLTLIYQGEVKGTIPGETFAQMYYRYNVGEKANDIIMNGLLGGGEPG